jgi:3-oxoacyl-ACP reductase-like protein
MLPLAIHPIGGLNMSIFGTIVNKLFGKAKPDQPPPAVEPTPDPAVAQAAAQAAAPDAAPAPAPLADVDVAAVMDQLVSESGQTLNWRVSIVDTMKALGVDSSLDHRKQLATELKYSDSASMNVWLHKQVMAALAANGGKLPPDLAA